MYYEYTIIYILYLMSPLLYRLPSAAGPSVEAVPESYGQDRTHTPGRARGRGRGRGVARQYPVSPRHQSRSPVRPQLTEAWKTEHDPDNNVPRLPHFCPKRVPGVQAPLDSGEPDPLEIFSNFFDAEVLNILCVNTNKNAEKNSSG